MVPQERRTRARRSALAIPFLFCSIQHLQEFPMNAGVVGKLRMKCGRHGLSLAYKHGVIALTRQDFDSVPDSLDLGCPNEDHLERIAAESCRALMNRTFKLAPIGISTDANV